MYLFPALQCKLQFMRKLYLLLVLVYSISFAQKKKKTDYPSPPAITYDTLNDAIKGTKWFFNIDNLTDKELLLDDNPNQPDLLYFVDAKKVQVILNHRDCKASINGTYMILLPYLQSPQVVFGDYQSFKMARSKNNNACTKPLIAFLEQYLEVTYDTENRTLFFSKHEETAPMIGIPN